MSRYSRIFLRPKDSRGSLTGGSSSVDPIQSSSPGYSYPPSHDDSRSHATASPMLLPPPHPYTLGAVHSTAHTDEPRTVFHSMREADTSEKAAHTYQPEQPRSRTPLPTFRMHLHPLILLLIFLPIPPLLSLLYMVTGHAILRSRPALQAPLLSSVEAGATGGIILALPLALLLYLLVFPAYSNQSATAPEDFFEDDDSSTARTTRWVAYASYAVCAILVLCIGAVAGPLGVTCLSSGDTEAFVRSSRMLSASAAAQAGMLGGVVLVLVVLALGVVALVGWSVHVRRKGAPSAS